MVDFSKIVAPSPKILPVDPIELFQKLKVMDQGINDLWLAQGDALRDWHNNRSNPDIGIVLNTGAGKTLVGLLAAQSLVNETKSKVLYACSSIQLVEQTAEKATRYGLKVTTYFRGNYSNDLFSRCVAPCVTTYHALFNGKSIFFREDVAAVVFDDAHTAEHLLRNYFSVRIKKASFESLYTQILSLFEDYFQNIGRAVSFEETKQGMAERVLFVPPFEVREQHVELVRNLSFGGLFDSIDTKFSWNHIKNSLDLCCVLITGTEVTITPPFVPVLTLPYFNDDIRRIYLSATLSTPDAFARTFGVVPSKVVAPTTTAGECERLVAIPSKLDNVSDDVETAISVIENRKALIIVPTYLRAKKWQTVVEPPPKESVSEYVAAFKESSDNSKLLLAARYDGVDLPGDTCRLMVIDDLPIGMGILERFTWESLNMNNSLRSTIASRLVQSFGRISRGMSDHGVVILTGKGLLNWLLDPNNMAILPVFLQKQILLGDQISDTLVDIDDFNQSLDKCLNRNPVWMSAYEGFMQEAIVQKTMQDIDTFQELAKSEAAYAKHLWQRDYEIAAKVFSGTLDTAYSVSKNTGAWHSLWLGYAQEMTGDRESACNLYIKAHENQNNIPPLRQTNNTSQASASSQVLKIKEQIKISSEGTVSLPRSISQDLCFLDGSGSVSQTEEALRFLGQYLGLISTRPENEYGTGPDVLWIAKQGPALCIEAKTNKGTKSVYSKNDVGQMANHVQWVNEHETVDDVIPLFVGPITGVSGSASPPANFCVVPLEAFNDLSKTLVAALREVTTSALPSTLLERLSDKIEKRKLKYPELLDLLGYQVLRDIPSA